MDTNKFFLDGILALSRMEQQGFRIDLDYISRKKTEIDQQIIKLEKEFISSKFYAGWKNSQNGKINIYSPIQLSNYIYGVKKIRINKETITGQGSTDEETLKQLGIPELEILLRIKKLKKIRDTYLEGFEKEQVDGYIHPFFNLHLVKTFRGSSDSPNFQNIPKRDKEAMDICRKAIFPHPGHLLMEIDYKQLEVRVSACYCNDKKLIEDILEGDMHRDMASEIFCIKKYRTDEPSHKVLRNAAKNGFVFPQFYGDYYKNCASNLAVNWGELPKHGRWKNGMGIPFENVNLADHLIANGFKSLDDFTLHIQKIEQDFWGKRYYTFSKWKEEWWNKYLKTGIVYSKTGFEYSGVMNKKDVVNYPIQGCLQGSSKILTNEGWHRIDTLLNKNVKVWTGFEWADAFAINMGKAQLAKIELDSGIIIKCDTRHKLKNELNNWVNFKDLQIGNNVALPIIPNCLEASSNITWEFNRFNPNFELYRYNKIKSIKIINKEEDTYTMSVNHPLHQFVADGVITKNSAFHCLLWDIIEINKAIISEHLDTRLVGQIHDAIVLDVNPKELKYIVDIVKCIMCRDIRKVWDWIIVPLDVDIEICDVDASWAEKKEYKS